MNIRIKVPSMAQFVPSSIFTMIGDSSYFRGLFNYESRNKVKKFGKSKWYVGYAKITFSTDLNHFFESRYTPVDDFQNWDDPFYTNAWFQDIPEFLPDTTKHTFKSVVMSLRDYYRSWLKSDTYQGVKEKNYDYIVDHWLGWDKDTNTFPFQHSIKRSPYLMLSSLHGLCNGPMIGNYIKTDIIYSHDDIKITVSPCQ